MNIVYLDLLSIDEYQQIFDANPMVVVGFFTIDLKGRTFLLDADIEKVLSDYKSFKPEWTVYVKGKVMFSDPYAGVEIGVAGEGVEEFEREYNGRGYN